MSRLDDLPPDLRATLSLLVDRGKSYAQVSELLGIPESAVRDRAHAALDTLAGAPQGLDSQISTGASPGAPISGRAPAAAGAGSARVRSDAASGTTPGLPVSRRGGALLLAGIVVVVVVVIVLLTSGGGGSSHTGSGTAASSSTGTSASTSSTGSTGTKSGTAKTPAVTNQLTLTSPEPSSKAVGLVEVLAEGSQRAIVIAAEHLPSSNGFFYLVWLYNSPSSATPVGRAPTVGANGRLQGGALLPSDAGNYHHILLTRETSEHPTTPGPVVLSGAFSLNK
jgi:hypothetical protein